MKKRPKVDYKKCQACGFCSVACPVSCLTMTKKGMDSLNNLYPEVRRDSKNECIGCGICAKSCPFDAIVMRTIL